MYRGVNPTPTLRKQNLPIVWRNSIGVGVSNELSLEIREMLEQKCGQVTIFTKMQQILHVQSIHTILRVVLDELVRYEQRLVGVGGTETVERETTGQTGDGTEQTLERLGHVVGDEVLVDLHHRNEGLLRVGQLRLTTAAKELLVVNHAV